MWEEQLVDPPNEYITMEYGWRCQIYTHTERQNLTKEITEVQLAKVYCDNMQDK